MPYPPWLPDLFPVDPWQHDTYDMLYDLFEQDFKETQPVYLGQRVWFFPETEDGKEKIIWHLTTREDYDAADRMPDLRRCERIPWARPAIDQPGQPDVLAWDYKEGDGSTKTYVWLEDFDFVLTYEKVS